MSVVYSNKKVSYRFSLTIRKRGQGEAAVYQAHAYSRNMNGKSFNGKTFPTFMESYLDIIESIITVEQSYADFETKNMKNDLSQLINWARYDNEWT